MRWRSAGGSYTIIPRTGATIALTSWPLIVRTNAKHLTSESGKDSIIRAYDSIIVEPRVRSLWRGVRGGVCGAICALRACVRDAGGVAPDGVGAQRNALPDAPLSHSGGSGLSGGGAGAHPRAAALERDGLYVDLAGDDDPSAIEFEGAPAKVFRPEYIIVIAASVGGHKDLARIEQMMEQTKIDRMLLDEIMRRYNLTLPNP